MPALPLDIKKLAGVMAMDRADSGVSFFHLTLE